MNIGKVKVRQPRVHDRRDTGKREKFSSKILPPYLRKTKNVDEVDSLALSQGDQHRRLSRGVAVVLGRRNEGLIGIDNHAFQKSLGGRIPGVVEAFDGKQGVRVHSGRWGHFNVRFEEDGKQYTLVLIGATKDERKELIAIQDGYRESEQSWKSLLFEVKTRSSAIDPKLVIGDGTLGFWKMLPKVLSHDTFATLLSSQDG